ncbi:MAG: hypothetical protein A2W29_06855 [Gemmatimonadetes bacterium RBG_16_66_8]|nr:MAG: hypothetical protein A2W29_06855 [Gemmatimonadetes bacterium RBG_16_66_8]
MGTVVLRLTDAPNAEFESAKVWVSRAYLIGGTDSTGPQITITDTPAEYELLDLTNGVTALMGSADVPLGTYTQLRLVVDSAKVTLKSPKMFSDGSSTKSMKVPSGQQTGIKVVFSGPVDVVPGETILVVDFDVLRSFHHTGPSSSPTGMQFKPVLHATVQNIAASIAGTVTPASAKATLYAIRGGSTDTVATALADTVSGNYALRFLPPDTYTVAVDGSGLTGTKTVTVGAGENKTGVNFP